MTQPILLNLPIPIRTPRLLMRYLLPGEGAELNAAIRESYKELRKWMPWAEKLPTLDESETFVRQAQAQWILRQDFTLPIFDRSGKNHLGMTSLCRMNWAVPCFEMGYWVRTSAANQGYVTEAINAVTRYAFEVLKAARVEIRCDADNQRSVKVTERLGYQLEGRLRRDSLKCLNQGLRDTLVFSRIDLDGLPPLAVSWGDI
jgi:RimJ/RimL family protein N-acetyltransferase